MRSKATLAAIWVAATLVAVTVVWQSLSFVSTRTDSPESATLPVLAPETTVAGDTVGSLGSLGPGVTAGGQALGPGSGAGSDTGSGDSVPSATTSTTGPTTTQPPARSTTTLPAGTVAQTFNVTGGTALVWFSPAGAVVKWATAADGWTARIEASEHGGSQIEFRRGEARTRLDVWWDKGPQNQVRSDGDGDGGSGKD